MQFERNITIVSTLIVDGVGFFTKIKNTDLWNFILYLHCLVPLKAFFLNLVYDISS